MTCDTIEALITRALSCSFITCATIATFETSFVCLTTQAFPCIRVFTDTICSGIYIIQIYGFCTPCTLAIPIPWLVPAAQYLGYNIEIINNQVGDDNKKYADALRFGLLPPAARSRAVHVFAARTSVGSSAIAFPVTFCRTVVASATTQNSLVTVAMYRFCDRTVPKSRHPRPLFRNCRVWQT